ncbi:MAG: tagaturonate reductase [Clostridia bacterium]|nr:tagaturonate reductase [Clostridia bacterium]
MKIQERYRERVKHPAKVLQFGEGNFLRAFADWMIDRSNKTKGTKIGVTVVQPLAGGLVEMLNDQDGLYTVFENGLQSGELIERHTVVEAISGGINPYTDFEAFLATARELSYEMVLSNTTEAGIVVNAADRYEDAPQSTYPGKLTRWLHERYKAFEGSVESGLVILPCELIEANAETLKTCIMTYTELWKLEEGFVKWLNQANHFCSTLVDRIVPGYPRDKVESLEEKLGYEDKLMIETEPYYLWVIEADAAVQAKLSFDDSLNIVFTDSLFNYRTRKVRLLNGPHTCMVPVGLLYGVETVKEAVTHDVVGAYVHQVMHDEMIPAVPMDNDALAIYAEEVLDRFKNPFVKHQLMSIALNSHSKYKTRVLPTIKEYVVIKACLPKKAVFALAAMFRLFKGDIGGQKIDLKDDAEILALHESLWSQYDQGVITLENLVETLLGDESIWGENLNQMTGLTALTTTYLTQIVDQGMVSALGALL